MTRCMITFKFTVTMVGRLKAEGAIHVSFTVCCCVHGLLCPGVFQYEAGCEHLMRSQVLNQSLWQDTRNS